jgi:hypothetical protein
VLASGTDELFERRIRLVYFCYTDIELQRPETHDIGRSFGGPTASGYSSSALTSPNTVFTSRKTSARPDSLQFSKLQVSQPNLLTAIPARMQDHPRSTPIPMSDGEDDIALAGQS